MSAKSPTPDRADMKAAARIHFGRGGDAAGFAREHDLPRSTVIGWRMKWDKDRAVTVMGRPRKLQLFNEHQALEAILASKQVNTWRTVQEYIRRNTGDMLGRRTVFRLLKCWDISGEIGCYGTGFRVTHIPWQQPPGTIDRTIDRKGYGKRGILWRIIFRGRMAGFVFSADKSQGELQSIFEALTRWSRRPISMFHSDHRRLEQMLRKQNARQFSG